MPRIARIKFKNLIYHVISRGNNKMNIFHKRKDYEHYLKIVQKYQQKFTFWLYHFVLMPNHVHFLLKSESDISKVMHCINLCYAQYYKRNYQHIGHFWQDRFKSYIIEDDDYLLAVGRYIELNPLRAGLVKRPEEYEYSSYSFYAYGRDCGIAVSPDYWYLDLAKDPITRQQKYRKFIFPDISKLKVIKSQFLGSEEFVLKLIKDKFKERIKNKRGRPRKNPKELICNLL